MLCILCFFVSSFNISLLLSPQAREFNMRRSVVRGEKKGKEFKTSQAQIQTQCTYTTYFWKMSFSSRSHGMTPVISVSSKLSTHQTHTHTTSKLWLHFAALQMYLRKHTICIDSNLYITTVEVISVDICQVWLLSYAEEKRDQIKLVRAWQTRWQ